MKEVPITPFHFKQELSRAHTARAASVTCSASICSSRVMRSLVYQARLLLDRVGKGRRVKRGLA